MSKPLDFYFWPTPNCWKVSILLEELGIAYATCPVDIGAGDQHTDDFARISPNKRVPAITDHDVQGAPLHLFESGAIMVYLAEKHRAFLPSDPRDRVEALAWCFWQVGNLGPMAGQHSHFFNYAPEPEKQGYSAARYRAEYVRCIEVLEARLTGRDWVVGDGYSIADMICWPWILIAKAMEVPLDDYPAVTDWRARVKVRPAVQRGVDLLKKRARTGPIDQDVRANLF